MKKARKPDNGQPKLTMEDLCEIRHSGHKWEGYKAKRCRRCGKKKE